MVFIGNPRRGTNRGGGDRIILRSMQSKLQLQQTCGILSIKIKIEVVDVGVVRVFIPNLFLLKGVHPPILRPLHPQEVQERGAVGDGGDGLGRAWVLEVILQVVVRAGKKPPRRAWVLFHLGPLEVLLRPILPGPAWAFAYSSRFSFALVR